MGMIKHKIEASAAGQVLFGAACGFFASLILFSFGLPLMILFFAGAAGLSTVGQGLTQMRAAKMRRERFKEGIPSAERDARVKFGFGAVFALMNLLRFVFVLMQGFARQTKAGMGQASSTSHRTRGDDWGPMPHAVTARPESIGVAVLLVGLISGATLIWLGVQKVRKPATLHQGYLFAAAGIFDIILCAMIYRLIS